MRGTFGPVFRTSTGFSTDTDGFSTRLAVSTAGPYDPAEMRTRAIGRQLNRGRFFFRPYALAGNPRELLIAAVCILLIGAISIAEVLTPDDAVVALALLPLLAAMWVLSSRPAAVVVVVAAVFFGLAVAVDPTSRITVSLLGLAVFVTALVARVYATGLASLLSGRRHIRPALTGWAPARAVGDWSEGLRSLTRRELEVARLAAEGHTTPEIGRRLNIGRRTVESHLASAYSKLRIRSRVQLIRMASLLGAPPTA